MRSGISCDAPYHAPTPVPLFMPKGHMRRNPGPRDYSARRNCQSNATANRTNATAENARLSRAFRHAHQTSSAPGDQFPGTPSPVVLASDFELSPAVTATLLREALPFHCGDQSRSAAHPLLSQSASEEPRQKELRCHEIVER